MKFYIAVDHYGTTVGCFTKMAQAKAAARAADGPSTVEVIEMPVSAETICRVLGNAGGYAHTMRTVPVTR